jgi:threonine dehydratase
MGRAVAWYARQLGVPCTVVVPDDAEAAKVEAIVRLGARIVPLPFARYQEIQRERDYPGAEGLLIHPFADQAVMAGNGTIGLEILEDAPDVAAVLVPYGGGGLSCGIASALRASGSNARVFGCEVASGAPLAASLAVGRPVETDYAPSFVTGIGAPFVFPEMWSLASELLAGALVASLSDVAQAIRLLALGNHVVAEGAAAVPVAAALAGQAGSGKVVCVVSGGNIGSADLVTILQGGIP